MSLNYFAPFIDASGLNIPTFQSVLNLYTQSAQSIFGSQIYLGNDSQDYQLYSVIAKSWSDLANAVLYSYNSRSPNTAIGTGLDDVTTINGITRDQETFSTCPVNLTGTPFTAINTGVVSDINRNLWSLPNQVILDSGGNLSATATCQIPGPVTATPGQINNIQTPTQGWTGVINTVSATLGRPAETDAQYRARQANSVENPSQALTAGTLGSVLAVPNVVNAQLYENDTNGILNYVGNGFNPGGFPEHSITVVVNGGDGQSIANAIAIRKTPGCSTVGDQTYTYLDQYGVPNIISFYLVALQTISAVIIFTPLTNYTTAIGTMVQNAVAAYINGLAIGQNVINSQIVAAANSINNQQYPFFSINSCQAKIGSGGLTTANLIIEYNQQAVTTISDIDFANVNAPPQFQFNLPTNSQMLGV